jgi:hypothetical protein
MLIAAVIVAKIGVDGMFMTIIEVLTKCLFIAVVVIIAKIGVNGILMTIIEVLTECL